MNGNLAFNFIVTFWGERFRGYFCQFILSSLMAPGNIPSLANKQDSKFLIVTTKQDWEALQSEPIFKLMQQHIESIFFEMEMPKDNSKKMLIMSKGHKIASEYAYINKAIGVFVTPDLVVSNGAVARLQELISLGKSVVLSAAIRFQFEGSVAALKKAGHMIPGLPLTLSGRDMMRAVLPNLHSEVKRYIWDKPYYPLDAITSIWFQNKHNAVIHTFSWGPMAINYAAVNNHKTDTFDNWTLDGDYVFANCGDNINDDIYVVTDTDELAFASFTTEEDLHFDLKKDRLQKNFFISKLVKQTYLKIQYDSQTMDPLKRKLVKIPIFFHADKVSRSLVDLSNYSSNIIEDAVTLDIDGAIPLRSLDGQNFTITVFNEYYKPFEKKIERFIAKHPGLFKIFSARIRGTFYLFKALIHSVIIISHKITSFPHEVRRICIYIKYIYGQTRYHIKNNGMRAVLSRAYLVFSEKRWSKTYVAPDQLSITQEKF